ncbi:uncharacterized protein LOC141900311 [Tubulanus polymorphus]|uniref:uncharacterized protein LOC141900311 n=1 Tax=Tubulanus polymorphus TaxID=672921 RepID=UPI003DA621F9
MGDSSDSEKSVHASPPKPKRSSGPDTLKMMIEAIRHNDDPKGASVNFIKDYLVKQHGIDPSFVKHRIKRALTKGLESGVLSRPKTQADNPTSLSGRIKIVKAELAKQEKVASKPKPKSIAAKKKQVVKITKEAKAKKSPKPKNDEEGSGKKPIAKKVTVKATVKATKAKTTKKIATPTKATGTKKTANKAAADGKSKTTKTKKADSKTTAAKRGTKRSPKKTPSKAKAKAARAKK